jgi:hypothetical protein
MFVLVRLSEGLLVAHCYVLFSFLLGSALIPWLDRQDSETGNPRLLLTRLVCTSALGMAVIGFNAFFLASLGVMHPATVLALSVAEWLIAAAAHHTRPFSASYWKVRVAAVTRCWDPGALAVYYALILISVPAVIGNVAGSDPVGYHLVYAKEWANAGSLTVDPFLRFPFYASNFVLSFAMLMQLGGDVFVNFIEWAPAMLAILGIYSSSAFVLEERMRSFYASLAGVAMASSVAFAPFMLRWITTAYIDAPIGAFSLFALLSILLAVREKRAFWLWSAAFTCAYLVGMKASLVLFAPVYLLTILIAAHYARLDRRTTLAIAAAFLIFAAPWYARNFVLAGDPIPPALNIALHGRDGLMTAGEWALNTSDLRTGDPPAALAALPVRAYLNPLFLAGEPSVGVTTILLFAYAPLIVFLLLFVSGRPIDPSFWIAAALVTTSIAYWEFVSDLLRYATIFYFTLPVALALTMRQILPTARWAGAMAVVAAIVFAIPAPGTGDYYSGLYYNRYLYIGNDYASDADLSRYSADYTTTERAADLLEAARIKGPVFMLGSRVGYFFYERGIEAIGDWDGPAGWLRLFRAADANRAAEFLRALGVQAVLVTSAGVQGGLDVPIERQLKEAGFCRIPIDDTASLLIDSAAACRDRSALILAP